MSLNELEHLSKEFAGADPDDALNQVLKHPQIMCFSRTPGDRGGTAYVTTSAVYRLIGSVVTWVQSQHTADTISAPVSLISRQNLRRSAPP